MRLYFRLRAKHREPVDLFGSTQPGILPGHRDALVVPAIADIGAIVVAEPQSLVFAQGDCRRNSDAELFSKVSGLSTPFKLVLPPNARPG